MNPPPSPLFPKIEGGGIQLAFFCKIKFVSPLPIKLFYWSIGDEKKLITVTFYKKCRLFDFIWCSHIGGIVFCQILWRTFKVTCSYFQELIFTSNVLIWLLYMRKLFSLIFVDFKITFYGPKIWKSPKKLEFFFSNFETDIFKLVWRYQKTYQ